MEILSLYTNGSKFGKGTDVGNHYVKPGEDFSLALSQKIRKNIALGCGTGKQTWYTLYKNAIRSESGRNNGIPNRRQGM